MYSKYRSQSIEALSWAIIDASSSRGGTVEKGKDERVHQLDSILARRRTC